MADNAPTPCFQITYDEKPQKKEELKNLELIDKKEFKIEYKKIIYDIILSKTNDKEFLVFQCYQRNNKYNSFEARLNFIDLIKLSKAFKVCESIDDAYIIILNKFQNENVFIQETKDYKVRILYFSLANILTGEEQKIEIELKNNNKESHIMNEFEEKYNNLSQTVNKLTEENENIKKILNEYTQDKLKMEQKITKFEEEMKNMKKENEYLKKEIESLKLCIKDQKNNIINNNLQNNNNINNNIEIMTPLDNQKIDPLKIYIKKVLTESAYCPFAIDNTFTIFKSRIDNSILLVYCCKNNSLKFDDLCKQKNIKTIQKAHDNNIITLKYYDDIINNKDLVLSISCIDKIIKIWDISKLECITQLVSYKNNNFCLISSACLLFCKEEKNTYIITSSDYQQDNIKIFNLNGNEIGKISKKKDEDKSYFIESYLDKRQNKNYIISCNNKYVKSYDFSTKNVYKKYYDGKSNNDHMCAKIYESNNRNEIDLIESDIDGFVNIWNFHTGQILKKIKCCKGIQLRGICLWDEDHIFVAGDDNSIKLIDIKKEKLIKSLSGHSRTVCTLHKIFIPKIGECLISGGYNDEQIKLWSE